MPQSTQPANRFRVVWVAGIMLLGFAFRLYHLGTDPLWYDEICSLQSSTGHGYQALVLPPNQLIYLQDTVHLSNAKPFWRIWSSAMDHDAHPPIYFMVLRLWRDVFGTSEVTVRMPSVIASVAGIGLCAAVGAELFGTVAGCWAAALMAFSAPQIYFTHEARGYTLFPTFCLLATYAVLRIERAAGIEDDEERIPKRWPILLGVSSLAAMLTHYYSVLPLMAIAGYALVRLRRCARRDAIVALLCAAVIFAVAWGPHLLRQKSAFVANQIGEEENGNYGASWVMEQMPYAVFRELMGTDLTSENASLCIALIVAGGGLYSLVIAVRRKDSQLLLCHAWVLISIIALGVLDYRRHTAFLHLLRYLMPAAPGVFLLIAGMARSHRYWRHLLPVVAVCVCLMGWPQAYRSWKGGWLQFGHDLAIARQPGDCFVFFPRDPIYLDSTAFVAQYYLNDFRGPAVVIARPADAQLMQQLASARSIWMLVQTGVSAEERFAYLPLSGKAQVRSYPGVGDVWHIVPDRHG